MRRWSESNDPTSQFPQGTGTRNTDPDSVILALAAEQHGVVARGQLARAGIPAHTIKHRLKKGWLESIHRGVYRVGPIISPRCREMAALLACGPGAALSHRSAGALLGLLPSPPATAPVVISTIRDVRGMGRSIRIYRVRTLNADEVSHLDGLSLTTPTRTLLDLAGTLSTRQLEQVLARADRDGHLDREEIGSLLARYPRRPGAARLHALLAAPTGPAFTRSEAEERFLTLIRKAGLRPPETNVGVRGFEVDAFWREERLVVEIDGFAFHSSRSDFEKDRRRDGELAAAGLRVMRFTWLELTQRPEALLVRLAQALVARDAV